MAGLRKDVELIFRGEDRASPSIKAVRKSVSDLTGAVNEQIDAAARGEGSVDELAKAFRGLKAAQGDVNEIVKLATAYERQTAALAEQSAKVADAKAKQASVERASRGGRSPDKAACSALGIQRIVKLAGAIAKQQATRKRPSMKPAPRSMRQAVTRRISRRRKIEFVKPQSRRLGRSATPLAAMDQFKGTQAKGQANIAAQNEAAAFNKLAAGSGLPAAQITFLSTLENKLQALNAAIREDQAAQARLNAEFESRAAAVAATSASLLKQRLDEAAASADRFRPPRPVFVRWRRRSKPALGISRASAPKATQPPRARSASSTRFKRS
jgi:hypothetical protein